MSNFFSAAANTMDGTSKLPFFPAGFVGDVRVVACKGIITRKKDPAFIVELEVLSSNLAGVVHVGGRYSWFQSLKEEGTAYPSCIAFLYACLGLDPQRDKTKIDTEVKSKQDKWLNSAVNENPALGPTNVLAGATLRLQTANKKLKDGVSDFTLHNFMALPVAA